MEPQKSGVGSIIATIIIIALIILGGLYFWGKRVEENKTKENLVTDSTQPTTEDSETMAIKNTSQSDDLDSIDADLQATSFNNLSTEAQ